jgi:hypothetical protein
MFILKIGLCGYGFENQTDHDIELLGNRNKYHDQHIHVPTICVIQTYCQVLLRLSVVCSYISQMLVQIQSVFRLHFENKHYDR